MQNIEKNSRVARAALAVMDFLGNDLFM